MHFPVGLASPNLPNRCARAVKSSADRIVAFGASQDVKDLIVCKPANELIHDFKIRFAYQIAFSIDSFWPLWVSLQTYLITFPLQKPLNSSGVNADLIASIHSTPWP